MRIDANDHRFSIGETLQIKISIGQRSINERGETSIRRSVKKIFEKRRKIFRFRRKIDDKTEIFFFDAPIFDATTRRESFDVRPTNSIEILWNLFAVNRIRPSFERFDVIFDRQRRAERKLCSFDQRRMEKFSICFIGQPVEIDDDDSNRKTFQDFFEKFFFLREIVNRFRSAC